MKQKILARSACLLFVLLLFVIPTCKRACDCVSLKQSMLLNILGWDVHSRGGKYVSSSGFVLQHISESSHQNSIIFVLFCAPAISEALCLSGEMLHLLLLTGAGLMELRGWLALSAARLSVGCPRPLLKWLKDSSTDVLTASLVLMYIMSLV